MAGGRVFSLLPIALLISVLAVPTSVHGIGVNYGLVADNLPQPSAVVELYKSNNISSMRIFNPNHDVLEALRGSNIPLIVGVEHKDLQSLASDISAATNWVQTNIVAYSPDVSFSHIAVGNEIIPGELAQYVLPAMQNIQTALASAGLTIHVSTSIALSVLGSSYPPSAGAFTPEAQTYMEPILSFLATSGSPLLVNVYPYFSYKDNPDQIALSYALFTSQDVVVIDGPYGYKNLFDAMLDATYAAMEKVGGADVAVVVSESGWPSDGGFAANISNAQTYNQNLINHVGEGTPRRPTPIEAYIFAIFNENQKEEGTERNFGLFYPDTNPVYPISFSPSQQPPLDAISSNDFDVKTGGRECSVDVLHGGEDVLRQISGDDLVPDGYVAEGDAGQVGLYAEGSEARDWRSPLSEGIR
ncbi:glucan endo-1,3-beta-glucosidase-like [Musa acuminata AAA Group]|uniref:glucan endo-1,3-beta-glucosidase-like n=1 Tax=Musa acuminata AAA Group TaxID=214697 RepID=UPI0031CF0950